MFRGRELGLRMRFCRWGVSRESGRGGGGGIGRANRGSGGNVGCCGGIGDGRGGARGVRCSRDLLRMERSIERKTSE